MIKHIETFKSALMALSKNKVRSFLTMLGVIIGVFAVVTLVSMVQGVQNFVTDRFDQLGSNLVYVMPGKAGFDKDPAEYMGANKLEEKHAKLIEQYMSDDIESVTPLVQLGKKVSYKTNSYFSSFAGISYVGFSSFNMEIDKGRFFSKAEQSSKSRVVVLGSIVAKELFPDRSPIGERVKIDSKSYEVIGVAKEKNRNYDEMVSLPYTTVLSEYNTAQVSNLVIKFKSDRNLEDIVTKTKMTLLRDLKEDDFTVLTQKDILDSVSSILNILTVALGAIAGISLLVGGIGIMNIMLVSVTERTREIGLRKALGATSFNVGFQFMIESVLISVSGGIVGLFLGWLSTIAVRSFLRAQVPLWAVFLAFGFSLFVGMVFGTYPAVQASKKDPIEALRFE